MSAGESPVDGSQALRRVFAELRDASFMAGVAAVGHRIVHGGKAFTGPARLDASTLDALRRLVPLAPLHQQFNLALVTAAVEALPGALLIACFDAAFHVSQPRLARLYGLPRALSDDGILAYGFHGLSYAYVASLLAQRYGPRAGGRVIVAHLGSGVSLCAIHDGRSVATTRGSASRRARR
jgi:acetate kinase